MDRVRLEQIASHNNQEWRGTARQDKKRGNMDTPKQDEVRHLFYSKMADDRFGHAVAIVRGGEEVTFTHNSSDPLGSDVLWSDKGRVWEGKYSEIQDIAEHWSDSKARSPERHETQPIIDTSWQKERNMKNLFNRNKDEIRYLYLSEDDARQHKECTVADIGGLKIAYTFDSTDPLAKDYTWPDKKFVWAGKASAIKNAHKHSISKNRREKHHGHTGKKPEIRA
ncbi:MAG: hypothetical protein V1721_06125 [Pseudomonadota bacterium]